MQNYSILIPIHNEEKSVPDLLNALQFFIKDGHEIIIINDGSTDKSNEFLKSFNNIKLISTITNRGKGYAIKSGIEKASFGKIITFDGDMELHPSEITKLMILDKNNGIIAAMGYRFDRLNPIKSRFDFGNFIFTTLFNILFQTSHKDVLCCAKAFYAKELEGYKIKSNKFDIDIELSALLSIKCESRIPQISINYKRRSIEEGKKLKVSDGLSILSRILKMVKYF